ncbi:ribonuclease H-like domain-containing protein [Tanacetum coccineum]
MSHPHPKRNLVRTTVLTRSGTVPINTVRAAVNVNTARPLNTAYPKQTVNGAKPMLSTFNKAHSSIGRPFNKLTAKKNNSYNHTVNTIKGSRVNTARLKPAVNTARPKATVNAARPKARVNAGRPKAILKVVKGNLVNAIKASTWQAQVSNGLGPQKRLIFLPYVQGNPEQDLQEKGIFDSGCSRHMTGNKSYLTDFEEIDGGFVTFGGDSRGGKTTEKGKIRTGNLDFDVYFVKELKFNLFSVSQMCDKKNSVLFTDSECFVLSLDVKLTDENHVLLKVPREDNMYSVDLKNIVPKRGFTCLYAKATSDESDLWLRRLRHVNFKTMNKLVKGNLVKLEVEAMGGEMQMLKRCPDPSMPELEDIVHSDDDEDVGVEANMTNLNIDIPVILIPTTIIHKDHPIEQIIGDINSAPQTRRMIKNVTEQAMFSSVQQRTNHKDF